MPHTGNHSHDIAKLSASQVNAAMEKWQKEGSAANSALIDAGHGSTKPNSPEATGPLWDRWFLASRMISDLRHEIDVRYGPGSPQFLPIKRGWYGPRE